MAPLLALVFVAAGAHVALVGSGPGPTAGVVWVAKLSVRPASFDGVVRVSALGPRRIAVRASGGHGSYRARLVFPAAGRWTLTATAGGAVSRLGTVQVRPAPTPLTFVWPTSVDVEPGGSLLLIENGRGRLDRISTAGRVTRIAALTRPYGVRRAPSGAIFATAGPELMRIDGGGRPRRVAHAPSDIGPLAIAPNGDVYFATETQLWKLDGGAGTPVAVAPDTRLANPHGLAVAADGSLLVADTGDHRLLRIDPASGAVHELARMQAPLGLDAAPDGTMYVVDSIAGRVVHLSAAGARLGLVGPLFDDPYQVRVAPGGALYVVESLVAGDVRRIAPDGTVTTVSRR